MISQPCAKLPPKLVLEARTFVVRLNLVLVSESDEPVGLTRKKRLWLEDKDVGCIEVGVQLQG